MADPEPTRRKIQIEHSNQWDEVYRRISEWDVDRVQEATFMVVGAGALGNEVLKNLALLNVGHVLIVDFDEIEYHNLSRSVLFREADCGKRKVDAAEAGVRAINPNVKIKTIHGDIGLDVGLGIFRRVDVVMGCLDNRIARLYINRLCYKANKVWVDGAIENMSGRLHVYKPGVACYECQLSDEEMSMIQFRMGCTDIAQRNANFGRIPTTPITSSIIAAMQVQEGMKVVFGNEDKLLVNENFYYEGNSFTTLTFKNASLQEECLSHVGTLDILEIPELHCKMSVKEMLEFLHQRFGPEAKIVLDHEIALEITGKDSSYSTQLAVAKGHLNEERLEALRTTPDEVLVISKATNLLDDHFPYPDMSLQDIGVPPLDVLMVETSDDLHFVELTGDLPFLDYR